MLNDTQMSAIAVIVITIALLLVWAFCLLNPSAVAIFNSIIATVFLIFAGVSVWVLGGDNKNDRR
jgi:hypothetical protein